MVLLKKSTDQRPVFLNLFQIHLPVTALASILHRITGVLMILMLPVLVLLLALVLKRPGSLRYFELIHGQGVKLLIFSVVLAYMYHALAGLRHMYHDFSGDHSLQSTIVSAKLILLAWGIWIVLSGYKLWLI